MRGISGKTFIVAGGATGIGAGTAKRLAADGANVAVGDVNVAGSEATADAVNAAGGLLILGIGINLLEIGRIHVGNLLPALLYAIVGALLFP